MWNDVVSVTNRWYTCVTDWPVFFHLAEGARLLWSFEWRSITGRWPESCSNRCTRPTGLLKWLLTPRCTLTLLCLLSCPPYILQLTLRPLAHLNFPAEIMWNSLWHNEPYRFVMTCIYLPAWYWTWMGRVCVQPAWLWLMHDVFSLPQVDTL